MVGAGIGAGEPQRGQRKEGNAGQQAVVRFQRRFHVCQAEVAEECSVVII